MIEIAEFRPEEIDEAIEGLDGLQGIIAPFLRSVNKDGMGEQDVQQFVRHLTLAKHALIAMGDFLEGKMSEKEPPNAPLTLEELREMDGEPVFITVGGVPCIELGFWVLVEVCNDTGRVWLTNNLGGRTGYDTDAELDNDEIRAYRRKPEDGQGHA